MAVSNKQQNKLVSKSKSKSRRAIATTDLAVQGKATSAQVQSESRAADKSLRRASVKPDGTPSTMQTKASSKLKTANKRINQSIVARGGTPVKTYQKKAK